MAPGHGAGSRGNCYVTGYSTTNNSFDWVTIKYSPDGTELWSQRYEGPDNASDQPSAIAVSPDGETWVAGISQAPDGATAFALVKYDPDGNVLWTSRLEGAEFVTPGYMGWGLAGLAVDSAGNAYVTGPAKLVGSGYHFLIVKYASTGEELWVRSAGEYEDARPTALVLDGSGNLIVSGHAAGTFDALDILTVKFDADGNLLWSVRYDGLGNEELQSAHALCTDPAGNIYVAGDRSTAFEVQFVTVMYSPDGAMLWDASYAGPAGEWFSAGAVQTDLLGNVYVTGEGTYLEGGYWARDWTTVKYDANGAQLWAARHRGAGPGFGSANAALTADPLDGSVYVGAAGFTTLKCNAEGNLVWAVSRPSSFASALAVNVEGNELFQAGIKENAAPSSDTVDLVTVKYTQTIDSSLPRAFVSPTGIKSVAGSNVTFSAVVDGPGPFTYQWRFNGRPMPCACPAAMPTSRMARPACK